MMDNDEFDAQSTEGVMPGHCAMVEKESGLIRYVGPVASAPNPAGRGWHIFLNPDDWLKLKAATDKNRH